MSKVLSRNYSGASNTSISTANMAPKYEIPQEHKGELEHVKGPIDPRTDDEIIASLTRFQPVTEGSEKNIWGFWHAGVEAMRGWQKRNVADWVRMHSAQGWTVRILNTKEGSPNHVLKFLPDKLFPEAFLTGTMDGPYVGQHSADLYKTAVLYTYGGVYVDVGVILIRHLDRMLWDKLSDPKSPYNISVCSIMPTVTINHFIASRKGDPLIKNW